MTAGVGVHGRHLEETQSFGHVLGLDLLLKAHLGQTLAETDQGFQLTDRDGDDGLVAVVAIFQGSFADLVADANVGRCQDVAGLLAETGGALGAAVLHVLLHGGDVELSLAGGGHPHGLLGDGLGGAGTGGPGGGAAGGAAVAHTIAPGEGTATIDAGGIGRHEAAQGSAADVAGVARGVDVDAHHVPADHPIELLVPHVPHQEDEVEPTQDGRHEVDVLAGRLEVVVPAEDGVGRRQHAGAAVEDRGDAGLGHRYRLLLHGLVDGDAVGGTHLVELVDAYDASVGQHHGTALEVELSAGVLDDAGREAGGARALPGRVDSDGGAAGGVLEELRLGHGWIAQ